MIAQVYHVNRDDVIAVIAELAANWPGINSHITIRSSDVSTCIFSN